MALVEGELDAGGVGAAGVTTLKELKVIDAGSAAGNVILTSIDGHIDGLETLGTAGNVSTASIDSKSSTIIAGLSSIDGHVDGLEASAASIDTKLSSQATAAKQDTGNTSLASVDGKFPAAAALTGESAAPANATTIGVILRAFDAARTAWSTLQTGVVGIATTVLGFLNVLVYGKNNVTPIVVPDGSYSGLQIDGSGYLKTAEQYVDQALDNVNLLIATAMKPVANSANALSIDKSAAAEASSVTKASPGRLYFMIMYNAGVVTQFLQFYNLTAVPADTAVPEISIAIPASSGIVVPLECYGDAFTVGICWAMSTTVATKTISTATAFGRVYYL